MNNSVYGKRMVNLRTRIKVRLVNNAEDYKYLLQSSALLTNLTFSEPTFVSKKIFNKKFIAILEIKPALTLDKSIMVGFSIFELR